MTSSRPPRRSPTADRPVLEVRLDRPANSGSAVGRDDDGRAVFCDGGLAGELVRVELDTQKKRFARGRVIEVLEPAPRRIDARCATHHAGCGGCDLAHASDGLQSEVRAAVVRDSLIRIARLAPEVVDAAIALAPKTVPNMVARYRTTVRAAIAGGRAGYRRRSSHDVVAADECLVAHPLIEELLRDGRFGPAAGAEAVLRVSQMTEQRLVVIDGDPNAVEVPSDIRIVSRAELQAGAEAFITEHAGGRDWRVSAQSFFQAGPEIASNLVEAVRWASGDMAGSTVVDAYAGIGLFAGTVGARAAQVLAVERSGSSTADARVNLAGSNATVIESAVEDWAAIPADLVIADPARSGLGRAGVDSLLECKAPRFVLVSCDTGSLGRDVGLLADAGYELESVQLVDAFHDTSHVEAIAALHY